MKWVIRGVFFFLLIHVLVGEMKLTSIYKSKNAISKLNRMANLLKQLTERELLNCSLSLFGTKNSNYEVMTDTLRHAASNLTMPMQAFDHLPPIPSYSTSLFKRDVFFCDAYVFFLPFSFTLNSTFFQFLNTTDANWNFKGRYVFVSQVYKDQLENWKKISKSYKVKKTLNALSVWPSKNEDAYEIWSHFVYSLDYVRKLGTYRKPEDLGKSDRFFPRKLRNLHGFPLVVISFPHPPSIFGNLDKQGNFVPTGGIDVRFIETLAEALNFEVKWKHPGPELWGALLPNGTYTGLDGQISAGEGDIGVANIFLGEVRSRFILFTYPYDFERICFITPAPLELPHWLSITYPFSIKVWVVVLSSLFVLSVILSLAAKMQIAETDSSFKSSFLFVLQVFTGRQPINNSYSNSLRLTTVSMGLLGFILTICFSGNLTAVLTVKTFEPPIKTMEDLYNSKYPLLGIGSFWRTLFKSSSRKFAVLLSNRYVVVRDLHTALKNVADRKGALLENLEYLKFMKAKHFTTKSGESPLRIPEDCFFSVGVSAELNKFSPLKDVIDKIILGMQAGGLVNKFFDDVLGGNFNDSSSNEIDSWIINHGDELAITDGNVILTVYHLLGAFFIIGAFLCISCIVFFIEVLYFRIKTYRVSRVLQTI